MNTPEKPVGTGLTLTSEGRKARGSSHDLAMRGQNMLMGKKQWNFMSLLNMEGGHIRRTYNRCLH